MVCLEDIIGREHPKEFGELNVISNSKGQDPVVEIQKADLLQSMAKGFLRYEKLIFILYYQEEMTMKEIGDN